MWELWKTSFLTVLDKHAPIREKKVRNEPSVPWLTNTIKQQIREGDRSLAVKNKSDNHWKAYKLSRNRLEIAFVIILLILPKLSIKMIELTLWTILQATRKLNFQTVSDSEVHRLILYLNPRKSTGIDKIPAKITRIASPGIANSLTKMFNGAISNQSVPSE